MAAGSFFLALIIAVLLVLIFSFGFNSRGPWGSFWTFFLILFLGIWAAAIWARPAGPYIYGIAWLPALLVGITLALLLAAATPTDTRTTRTTTTDPDRVRATARPEDDSAAVAVGAFFWTLLILFFIIVLIGIIV